MKKILALVVAVLFALSMAGLSFAADAKDAKKDAAPAKAEEKKDAKKDAAPAKAEEKKDAKKDDQPKKKKKAAEGC